jgi:hypothetical protein
MISAEFLQALLSPDAAQRQSAEQHLKLLTVPARCTGLLQALQSQQQSQQQHLAQLAAVLLRRDITALADAAQAESLIEPLLALLQNRAAPTPAPPAVSNCLAEVCASLQWLDSAKSVETVQRILKVRTITD